MGSTSPCGSASGAVVILWLAPSPPPCSFLNKMPYVVLWMLASASLSLTSNAVCDLVNLRIGECLEDACLIDMTISSIAVMYLSLYMIVD